ncbi:hypothetical protein KY360_04960 [Candidatus Woesearchaeota archaeon]|nr:hypothetical protein [Candidatus Woesearchaeota archaeon]
MSVFLKTDSASFAEATSDIQLNLTAAFNQVKEEFDEHLAAINGNTNEIQSNYSYLCELDSKIEKLKERMDQIQIFLQKSQGFMAEENKKFEVSRLTKNEKEVFLVLYTLDESKGNVSYKDLARNIGLTEELVCSYINNMVAKGVPITKRYINNKPYLKLNQDFKRLQTKENILKIEQTTIRNLF